VFGQVIAPLAGAAALLGAFFGFQAGAPVSIAVGLSVWGGIWVLDRFVHRSENTSGGGSGQNDLMAAASRVETVRAAAMTVQRPDHRAVLLRVVDSAGAMLDEAFADADKRRRYRKALGHRLWHVEALAARIVGLEQAGRPNPDLMDRATELLHRLADALDQARRQSRQEDEQDLDIRLDVIEREMDQELGPFAGATGRGR